MNTVELEAQKAWLAREILCADNESMINYMWVSFKGYNLPAYRQEKRKKREVGFLEGKAQVTFHDDWSMTPEELGMV